MKKALCVFMVIGFLLVGSLPVAAETYTLAMLPSIGWSHYRVAEVKGFWEKQGISIKLIDYAQPLDKFHGALNNRYDFGPVPLAVLPLLWKNGLQTMSYLGTFSISDYHKYVVIKNDLEHKSLTGQTIGVFLADFSNRFLLSSYLKTVNTTLNDIRIVEMSPKELEANFTHDRLRAIVTMDRGNRFYEQANGMVAISTHEFYEPHGLAITKKGGKDAIPAEDLKKILRGCVEAIEWLRDPANWEEYKGILQQYCLADRPNLSDDQIRELMREGKYVDPQTLLGHNQKLLRDYFTQFRAFLAAEGRLEEDVLNVFTYDNVIYNQALIEVLQEYVN